MYSRVRRIVRENASHSLLRNGHAPLGQHRMEGSMAAVRTLHYVHALLVPYCSSLRGVRWGLR